MIVTANSTVLKSDNGYFIISDNNLSVERNNLS